MDQYKILFLLCILYCMVVGEVMSQDYSVGYDSYFLKDYSRETDSLEYRPILFNIWYPGEDDRSKSYINRRELLKLKGNSTTEIKFSKAYYSYAVSSLKGYLFDQFESRDSALFEREFDIYLTTATRSKAKLKPLNKKFPLVIYHQGLGGTIDDNLELCEFLASKGYAVVGSTFFQSVKRMGPGNDQFSRQDLDLLISEASKYDFIDLDNIIYVGHSFGAQAGFTYINQDGCKVRLFISLDPTFDYYNQNQIDEIWHYLMPQIKSRSHLVRMPTVHMADFRKNSKPLFEIPKRYIYSDRLLITTNERITHDGFISLGNYEAKLLKKYDANFDIDTITYRQVNELILNIIKRRPILLSEVTVDTNYFHSDYWSKIEEVGSMSFYDTLEQRYGVDSVLNLIGFFNKYDPDTKNEMGWLAEYYLHNKNFEKAHRFSDNYLEKFPNYYLSQLVKGKILFEQKEVDKAKEYFKKAYDSTYHWFLKWEMQQYFEQNGISFKD